MVEQEIQGFDIDSTVVEPREFYSSLSEKYSGPEFNYEVDTKETQNLLTRFLNWFVNMLQDSLGVKINPEIQEIFSLVIYILVILVVLYFVIRMLLGKNAASFFKKKEKLVAPLLTEEEKLEELDLDALIKEALFQKNYRSVIRYRHLKSILAMHEKNIILYHFEKTNADYYNEIEDSSLKNDFQKASYYYDYVWYGNFELKESMYNDMKIFFERINIKIATLG